MSDLYITNKDLVPPGGFRYRQQETDFLVTAPSWKELLTRTKQHRLVNNLPIGLEFEREVERQLADLLPENFVTTVGEKRSAAVPQSAELKARRGSWPGPAWMGGLGANSSGAESYSRHRSSSAPDPACRRMLAEERPIHSFGSLVFACHGRGGDRHQVHGRLCGGSVRRAAGRSAKLRRPA